MSCKEQVFDFYRLVQSKLGMGEVWMQLGEHDVELLWFPAGTNLTEGARFWREHVSLSAICRADDSHVILAMRIAERMRDTHRAAVADRMAKDGRDGLSANRFA